MKAHVSINDLSVGMFVEAAVFDTNIDGITRYFLDPLNAVYEQPSTKKVRLNPHRQKQVAHAGGMLITSAKHVDALRQTGVSTVCINTDKCDILPDRMQPLDAQQDLEETADSAIEVMEESDIDSIDFTTAAATETPASPSQRQEVDNAKDTWIRVEVSADGQQAFIEELSFAADTTPDIDFILTALSDQFGIRNGLERQQVEEVIAQAAATPEHTIEGHFLFATGTPPALGSDGRVDYKFLQGLPEHIELSHADLHLAFSQYELDLVLDKQLQTRIVVPGEELAVVIPPTQGQAGIDVFGFPRKRFGFNNPLEAGSYVRAEGNRYLAEIYGYVRLRGDELSVIPPLWTCPDHMEAHFIYFPQVGPAVPLERPWLESILQAKEVTWGLRAEAIEQLLNQPPEPTQQTTVHIAQGRRPLPGTDGFIELAFEAHSTEGLFLENGSVDLKTHSRGLTVQADQCLADLFPPGRGESGTNLRGEETPGEMGEELKIEAGENVRLQRQDQTFVSFHSQIDGHAKIEDGTISVCPVLRIFGDVDASTGHITAKHDVHISGSVSPGYEIKSGGSVFIGGKVEEGTQIHAQGDVIAAEGVFGNDTKVVAFGKVETRCVQQGSVLARGDISVGSHAIRHKYAAAAASWWAPQKPTTPAPSPVARSFPATALKSAASALPAARAQ